MTNPDSMNHHSSHKAANKAYQFELDFRRPVRAAADDARKRAVFHKTATHQPRARSSETESLFSGRTSILSTPTGEHSAQAVVVGGVHYFYKVEGRRKATVTPFEQVREGFQQSLLEAERQRKLDEFIVSLTREGAKPGVSK